MATPPVFTSGSVLTAAQMNAVGLWLVKTDTVGSGVAVKVVTNAFTSDFDNYLVTYSGFTASVNGAAVVISLQTSGGVDNAANWKGNSFYVVSGNGAGLTNAVVNNSLTCEVGSAGTTTQSVSFTILGPNQAQRTKVQYQDADDSYWRTGAFVLVNNTAYTNLKVALNGGNLTGGTIRVYGYRN